MAVFLWLSASSSAPVPSNNPQIPSTNQKWKIAEELKLIPNNPSKQSNYFNGYLSFRDEYFSLKHEAKLREARTLLNKVGGEPFPGLVMVDALQRLSIDYHFQEEISQVLHAQYLNSLATTGYADHDLYEVSTRFRLLRQQGYNVPADVFYNFKDEEGEFKSSLSKDIRGLRGLYEASQLGMEGEEILDQASDFCTRVLNGWLKHLDNDQGRVVRNTLLHPFHKSPARLMAKNFTITGWSWAAVLQELAKLDCDLVQATHQNEILQVSKWWRQTGLAKELKYARDQPLKWYMWAMATLTDPSLSEQRVELTKPISFIYLIDDIFDVYGTLDELTLFTEAVNRWEIDSVEQLPNYMKICFRALYDITNQIADKAYKDHGWNPIDSLQKSWASLCDAFLVEAKWFASGELPSAEEYLENGIVSSGVHVVMVHAFILLGHGLTKETLHLLLQNPPVITSTAAILRLWDDLGSAKDEGQEGRDGSYIDCLMKERKGCSTESATSEVIRLISKAWKQINRELLHPNQLSPTVIDASLNIARMVPLMYSYDHNHSLPILEEHLNSMLPPHLN